MFIYQLVTFLYIYTRLESELSSTLASAALAVAGIENYG